MICTQDHGQYLYLTNLCLFVCNHGSKELITHYRDSIHNREYQNFYYRDSIIFTIAQPYFVLQSNYCLHNIIIIKCKLLISLYLGHLIQL